MKNLKNKIAIVTGASSGIGKAVAIALAERQYHLILISRSEEKLLAVKEKIKKTGGTASIYTLDVSDSTSVKKCIDDIVEKFGQIDVLFNNAGILKHGTTEIADADINKLLKINLNGAIYMAKYAAEQMKRQKNGYIMNLSSIGGKTAVSFAGVYAASKFGLTGFSEALSKEMSLYGVKVTNICPAMVATEMVTQDRTFPAEQMIQTQDIVKTVYYLLDLGKTALPTEIILSSLPFIETVTKATYRLYGFK